MMPPKNKWIISVILLLFIPVWLFLIAPELTKIPDNFNYRATVFSIDNFYDSGKQEFSGEAASDTKFYYEVVDKKDGILIIKNVFDVRTFTGEKIFSVERLYGIDPKTGKHVLGYGDKDREGYLFAPRNLEKGRDFVYWHINYDTPANMKFQEEETINGLVVYRYEADYHADQTKNLGHLPGVPKERGVNLDIRLQLWIEPVTGRMIKYEDHTVAYYYDINTKERIYPWNQFHNNFSEVSINENVAAANYEKLELFVVEKVIPVLLALIALLLLLIGNRIKSARQHILSVKSSLLPKMKIKTKLNVSIAISLVLIFILFGSFFITSTTTSKEITRVQLTGEIKETVSELNVLINDYLSNIGERALQQWHSRYNSGLLLLQKVGEGEGEGEKGTRELVKNMTVEYAQFGELFNEAIKINVDRQKLVEEGASPEKLAVNNAYYERKTFQLTISSQSIRSLASVLEKEAFSRLIIAYDLQRTVTIILIVLLFIFTAGISIIIQRSIAKPIDNLMEASRQIEKGNFKTRTDIKTGDEFENLEESFNKTAQALGVLDSERKQIDKAKTEFLSITSHELRSPITPIHAQLEMLENGYFGALNHRQKESIQIAIKNVERLDKIIEDFLEISRIEAARLKFNFVKTNLAKLIEEISQTMINPKMGKKVEFSIKANNIPTIEADPDRIAQVLRNLIGNAIKFSIENVKIEITAKHRNDHILISVKDNGMGISEKDQHHIFQPFFQAEHTLSRSFEGAGLGLAISKGIVQSQKGKMWVESKLGVGSTFYFTIPVKPARDIRPFRSVFSIKDKTGVIPTIK